MKEITHNGKHIHYYETVIRNDEDGRLGWYVTCSSCGHIRKRGRYKTDSLGYTNKEVVYDEILHQGLDDKSGVVNTAGS